MAPTNQNIIWQMFPLSLKINVKGGNTAIVYIVVAYKSKVMHVDYDTLNLFHIRHNINGYPRK